MPARSCLLGRNHVNIHARVRVLPHELSGGGGGGVLVDVVPRGSVCDAREHGTASKTR